MTNSMGTSAAVANFPATVASTRIVTTWLLGQLATLDLKSLKYLGRFSDRAAGNSERIVDVDLYHGSISGEMFPSSEIRRLILVHPGGISNHKLSAVVERQIIPKLIELRLLSR
jgi:hypothetical protein